MRSDEELMAAYVRGDASAFQELFARYAPLLERSLAQGLRTREEARDLVQQTFLQVHRARLDFDPAQRFRPWLFTIGLNLKRELFRRQKRRPQVSLDASPGPEPVGPPHGAARWEAGRDLERGLAQLRPEQREVIELHWFAGLSFAEIGACLGLTANAVKVRAHRGYVALRGILGEPREPEPER